MNYFSNYNLIDVIGFMTAGFAVVLALPMLLSRYRTRTHFFLCVFILIQGGLALWNVISWSQALGGATEELLSPFEHVPAITLIGLQGPVLLWYSYSLSGKQVRPRWFDKAVIAFFVLAPAPIAWLATPTGTWDFALCGGLGQAISIAYGICALLEVYRHNREIRQRYSKIHDRQLLWLGYLAFGFIGIWSLKLSGTLLVVFAGLPLSDLFGVISVFPIAFLIAWMAILGVSQRIPPINGRPGDSIGQVSAETDKTINPDWIRKLDNLMVSVKLYQDPDLHLDGLADSMGISPRSLSALINRHYRQNFYDFVNHHRVRDAQRQLKDPSLRSKTIQRVFEDAGFHSKSTFNTFFKKVTGKTPSQYRKAAQSDFDVYLGGSAHQASRSFPPNELN